MNAKSNAHHNRFVITTVILATFFLIMMGIGGAILGNGDTPSIEQETPPPPLPIGVPDKAVQAPRVPQQVAMASPPPPLSPPPAPKPDAVSRARFQQLFPMDIASQTMTQTAPPMQSGIGSLV